ncbi:hypothetical protein ANN_03437 [Periplaneta americana]|uniref:Uncharacterized protein n=1 Tax=Periplaneta americana TaxID=6978 RepID=A0ABQ8U1Y8_PERAM|nr:hypothetical protein ANN_03437 [Periplaneta americana]
MAGLCMGSNEPLGSLEAICKNLNIDNVVDEFDALHINGRINLQWLSYCVLYGGEIRRLTLQPKAYCAYHPMLLYKYRILHCDLNPSCGMDAVDM